MSTPEKYVIWAVTGRKPARRSPRRSSGRGPARNWKYRAWVRTLPSVVSGIEGCCEAAHTGSDGGMKQKASDYSCVPLTVEEHREYHRIGKPDFEAKHSIDLAAAVRSLNHAWFAHAAEVK